ncbi:MAG: choice-of-anchor B family protein [Gemmatimonadetes bacterium]|nr:choice-of-anchor B family protein [Gemmatimonadota bacterium]
MRCRTRTLIPIALLVAAAPLAAQSTPGTFMERARAFGASVAIASGDVLVGEPGNVLRPGLVYVYRPTTSGWAEAAILHASDSTPGDRFGTAMAVTGTTLAVSRTDPARGGGSIYFFLRDGQTWRETTMVRAPGPGRPDGFGASVAMRDDLLLVGAPAADSARGQVRVYRRAGSEWQLSATVRLSDAVAGDLFGNAVGMTGDQVLIGAPGRSERTGLIIVFDISNGVLNERARLAPSEMQRNLGLGATLSVGGNVAIVGTPGVDAGAALVYRRDAAGAWSQSSRIASPDPMPEGGGRRGGGPGFGMAVATDGRRAWIGAPGSGDGGAAFVVDITADGMMPTRVTSERAEGRDRFGQSLALEGDVAAAALLGDDSGAGSVAIFQRDAAIDTWREFAFVASPPEFLPAITGDSVRCTNNTAGHFNCGEVDLLGFLPVKDIGGNRGINLNDIWGWTDPVSGREYALVGRTDGTSFVDVSNPSNPVYVGDLPKTAESPVSTWRDIKVYRDHAYIVADGAGPHGMQVIDLTRLRQFNGTPITFTPDYHYRRINSAHNIVINEATGFAYAVGSSSGGETCGGGLHMIDIREPKNPVFAGCFADPQTGRASTGYSHDAMCITYNGPDEQHRGREICFGSNETAISIADVTDKANPVALARASYPSVAYSHQGWITEDHRYFYLDDELDEIQSRGPNGTPFKGTRTLIWDVSDLDDPKLVNEFFGATEASDHNLYIRGNFMYQSNYQAGLRVLDITDPVNPVEVGWFDTAPYGTNTPGFGGSWSNYPFFQSGIVVVTSGMEGLFIVRKRGRATIS